MVTASKYNLFSAALCIYAALGLILLSMAWIKGGIWRKSPVFCYRGKIHGSISAIAAFLAAAFLSAAACLSVPASGSDPRAGMALRRSGCEHPALCGDDGLRRQADPAASCAGMRFFCPRF